MRWALMVSCINLAAASVNATPLQVSMKGRVFVVDALRGVSIFRAGRREASEICKTQTPMHCRDFLSRKSGEPVSNAGENGPSSSTLLAA